MVYLIICILAVLGCLLAYKAPNLFFFICMSLFADPGGYITFYTNNITEGSIKVQEIFLYLSFLPVVFRIGEVSNAFRSPGISRLFLFLIFFSIYYVVVYGYIIPAYNDRADFLFFLKKNRLFILSPFVLISTYVMARNNLKTFLNLIIIFGTFILTLYFITLITKLPLVPFTRIERYAGSGINRISMLSYGYFDTILGLSFIVFVFNQKIPYKKLLLFGGSLMGVAIILTLTRRTYLYFILIILIIYWVNSKIKRISLAATIKKIFKPAFFVIILLGLSFPSYIKYSANIFPDLYALVTTGKNIYGEEDYRFAGTQGVEFIKKTFREKPLFGTGYMYEWFDSTDDFQGGKYKAHDNPLIGSFAVFGIIGALLNFLFYFLIIKFLVKAFQIIMQIKLESWSKPRIRYEFIFIVFIFSMFLSFFISQTFSYNADLFLVQTRIFWLFLLGILICCYEKIIVFNSTEIGSSTNSLMFHYD